MSSLSDDVRREIEELHLFFVKWFQGTTPRQSLTECFLAHLDPDLVFVPPDGRVLGAGGLGEAFEQTYGTNPAFEIRIRDVVVRRIIGDHVLATYTRDGRRVRRHLPTPTTLASPRCS